ncbi:hypothetical protein CYMTET_5233 [Cymbomonas tetramitiformis]|uniref:3-isopropylmalate dehydratase n=1 Tax=Cymbomonas tetramitiformis TaxID=36881 RepID=A0AAE0GZS0_9CHLO|nr:hypothetical protein CYMTET_5233 [Cymbomonas tetramitiformis]
MKCTSVNVGKTTGARSTLRTAASATHHLGALRTIQRAPKSSGSRQVCLVQGDRLGSYRQHSAASLRPLRSVLFSASRPRHLRCEAAVAAGSEAATGPRTLFDKIWADHVIDANDDGTSLIYIDRHLVHEVTSPQAFEGLRTAGRPVRRPDCTLATVDHNVPTSDRSEFKSVETFIKEEDSLTQVVALETNVKEFGVSYFGMDDKRQGIVHIIGPEQGFTLPGTTVVCGDSHTATHGAFGALAFGIGTSEVEHVLATQTLLQQQSKNMRILVEGKLAPGITSKDLILHIIGIIGTAGGTGNVIEFAGEAIRELSMEARMSMCNMAIESTFASNRGCSAAPLAKLALLNLFIVMKGFGNECHLELQAGARAGLVAPDDVTFEYLKGRPMAPIGDEREKAIAYWRSLSTDEGAM